MQLQVRRFDAEYASGGTKVDCDSAVALQTNDPADTVAVMADQILDGELFPWSCFSRLEWTVGKGAPGSGRRSHPSIIPHNWPTSKFRAWC